VAAFGKFHHDDVFKERSMIYITFDSPASVPRYIVFGNYANIGDLKETWKAPCYVMGAEFADVLPTDEDQMPPNGNPQPMRGQMQNNPHMFVLPTFPQIGWDEMPHQDDIQGQGGHQMQGNMEQNFGQGVDEHESMVLNPFDASDDSVNENFPNVVVARPMKGLDLTWL
jgi:hypothetical protein